MKKLMMFAAAMTIVGGAHAWTFCGDAAGENGCDLPVWDLTAKGKVGNWSSKGYKSVNKLALKGAIVGNMALEQILVGYETITNEVVDPDTGETNLVEVEVEVYEDGTECCLESFEVLIYDKSSKLMILFEEQEVDVFTMFGKNLNNVVRPGKSVSLEADVMWQLEGDDCDDSIIDLQFVGFGKGKMGKTKAKANTDPCGDNSVEGCEPFYNWPSWDGWFTGWFGYVPCNLVSPICDFDCELVDAVAGGTWKAKYNKKLSDAGTDEALLRKYKARDIVTLDEMCDE